MITLEQAKANSRIDYDDEDELLEIYRGAAEDACLAYLNRNVFETTVEVETAKAAGDDGAMLVNNSIIHAMLVTFSDMYENREGNNRSTMLPRAAKALLQYHRYFPLK